MEVNVKKVSLETLAGGAVGELFQRELDAVLENMADVNTEVKVARKITLEVIFVPREQRDACAVQINAKSKLAPVLPQTTMVHLTQDGRRQVAFEETLKERALFKDGDRVISIK